MADDTPQDRDEQRDENRAPEAATPGTPEAETPPAAPEAETPPAAPEAETPPAAPEPEPTPEPVAEEPPPAAREPEPTAEPVAEQQPPPAPEAEPIAAPEPTAEPAAPPPATPQPPVMAEPTAESAAVESPSAEPVAAAPEPDASSEPGARAEPPASAEAAAPAASEQHPATPDAAAPDEHDADEDEPTPRVKPAVPGADLEVDIVPEGMDPLARAEADPYALDDDEPLPPVEEGDERHQPIATAAIDLAAGARYNATGKRKTAIARVILRPGTGAYQINGRTLEQHFPRATLQRNIRQPLETVGYESRMDVVARMHGGGISAQAGALRHGISRALLEADPNLRGELKRRGFLTRDSRAKERKKAGLKKARKRPQFSKR